ncbi:MAG: MaoC family dehydratase N-terminal domain-containing protein [Candidatus Hydrogenedentes bacterium]|nr:MaoC family dehydratase N-terminal domain-containing protein [Candidatus Hydrogenedentota bacterium]
MNINSTYVGVFSKSLEVEVTARQCMNYAASIGDDNPWHLDDTRDAGIVAPPMLAVSLTWHISEQLVDFWGDKAFPYEVLTRQVHYSESIHWERPVYPGDKLRIEGQVETIVPHRAGSHLIIAYTAYDEQDQVVFVERIGGLLRGVTCEDAGKGKDDVTDYAGTAGAAPIWTKTVHVSKLASYIYDACANVPFPIHTSPAFAKSVGLPGIIFQGTGTLAIAVREITAAEADNDPRRIRAVQCRFIRMVKPDTDITVRMLQKETEGDIIKCHFTVVNAAGKPVLRDGCVEIASV